MGEKVVTLISKEAIEKRIEEMARDISADYTGRDLFLVCVLKGAFIFAADLIRRLTVETRIDFMDVSSYGKGMKSSSQMSLVLDLQDSIEDKDVLIIEDIADTGRSIDFLMRHMETKNPRSVKLCTLLDKPGSRVLPHINPDYTGFIIPDKFVVGFGLDFAQRYRNLPYVGYLDFEDDSLE
jgi:hypoxanthine phosphoribosyltransferase